MPLWTDILTPVEATGIARATLQEVEEQKGSLARWFPNAMVAADHIKFYIGDHGLVDDANYRALNAAPEIIGSDAIKSMLVELPPLSNNQPIDEATQHALKRMPDDQIRKSLIATTIRATKSIANTNEHVRGQILHTGTARKSTPQHNFLLSDDFGRSPELSFTAPQLWSDASTDALGQLQTWIDLYTAHNGGAEPAVMLMSRKVYAAFAKLGQFRTVLAGGDSRPPMADEVNAIVQAAGLPMIEQYNRSTSVGRVTHEDYVYLMPEPTDVNNPEGSALGATFWGETVTAGVPEYGIVDPQQPGLVVGVHRMDKVPYTVEVMADSIVLPVARDANKAMAVKVL